MALASGGQWFRGTSIAIAGHCMTHRVAMPCPPVQLGLSGRNSEDFWKDPGNTLKALPGILNDPQ